VNRGLTVSAIGIFGVFFASVDEVENNPFCISRKLYAKSFHNEPIFIGEK